MAVARAAPSVGSVPAPSSSRSTRLLLSHTLNISIMLVIWAENVESDCSMLCSSPMSTSTRPNTDISLSSAAGIIIPHMAIRVRSPMVFSVTVLPPVLGPVMTRVSKSLPSLISVATTFLGSIRGCRAFFRSIFPLSLSTGSLAFISKASFPFAKMTSSRTTASYPAFMLSAKPAASEESSARIRSISSRSLDSKILI